MIRPVIDSRLKIGSCFAWLLASFVLLGCQTEKTMTRPGDPLPPPPVEARVTPPDSIVTNIVVLAPYSLSDLDGNGLASEFPIAVYLYSKAFPLPFWKSGTLRVELFNEFPDGGERPLFDRTFGVDEVRGLRQTNVVGQFYALQLSLSEAQVLNLSEGRGGYRVIFESVSGDSRITSTIKRINVR